MLLYFFKYHKNRRICVDLPVIFSSRQFSKLQEVKQIKQYIIVRDPTSFHEACMKERHQHSFLRNISFYPLESYEKRAISKDIQTNSILKHIVYQLYPSNSDDSYLFSSYGVSFMYQV